MYTCMQTIFIIIIIINPINPVPYPFLFWDLEPVTKAGQARGLDSGGALVGEPQGRMGRIWQLATIVFFYGYNGITMVV